MTAPDLPENFVDTPPPAIAPAAELVARTDQIVIDRLAAGPAAGARQRQPRGDAAAIEIPARRGGDP